MQRLTDWKGWDSTPVWSPDESQILFTSDRGATPTELAIDEARSAGERGLAVHERGRKRRAPIFDDSAMQSVPTSWGR